METAQLVSRNRFSLKSIKSKVDVQFIGKSGFALAFRSGRAAALNVLAVFGIGTLVGAAIMLGQLPSIVDAVGAVAAALKWFWAWLESSRGSISALKDLATILGIGGGLVLFYKRRQHMPRLDVSLSVTHHPIDADRNLIVVRVTMRNHGVLMVAIPRATVFLQQVVPVPEAVQAGIDGRAPNRPVENAEIEWSTLESCEIPLDIVIEPGETDSKPWDFVVPSSVRAVRANVHLDNVKRKKHGWSFTTMYDIPAPEAEVSRDPLEPAENGDGMTGKDSFRKGITDDVAADLTRQQHKKQVPAPISVDDSPHDQAQPLKKTVPPPVDEKPK